MIFKRIASILTLLGVFWIHAFTPVSASEVPGDQAFQDRFRDVASELRCPTCVGLSVLESDAPFSKQIKSEVTNQLEAGKSADQILQFFTDRYGPWILRSPPKQGVNILAWVIPLSLLVFGPILVWYFVWRHRNHVTGNESVLPLDEILSCWEQDLAAARHAQRDAMGVKGGDL